MQSTTWKSQSISLGGCGVIALMFRVLNEWSVGAVVEVASTSWIQLTQKVHSLSGSNYSLTSFTQGTIDGAYNKWLRALPCYSPKTLTKIFENLFFYFSDIQPTNFANVEDMLFEVFRCEETDTINNIAIAQFLKVVIELVCKNSKLLFHSCKYHLPFHFLPCFFSFQENLHYAQDVYFSTNWFLRRGRSSIWMPFLSLVLSNTGLEIGHFEKTQGKKPQNSRKTQ